MTSLAIHTTHYLLGNIQQVFIQCDRIAAESVMTYSVCDTKHFHA